MEERITVGQVLRPHGIRGEVRVRPLADDPSVLLGLGEVFTEDGAGHRILGGRVDRGAVLLALRGVADRNAAEKLRGKFLLASRDRLPVPEGRYFIADLIGAEVVTSAGRRVGVVTDVITGSTDVFVLDAEGEEVLFPTAPGVLLGADVEKKVVTVDEKRFREVTEYAD